MSFLGPFCRLDIPSPLSSWYNCSSGCLLLFVFTSVCCYPLKNVALFLSSEAQTHLSIAVLWQQRADRTVSVLPFCNLVWTLWEILFVVTSFCLFMSSARASLRLVWDRGQGPCTWVTCQGWKRNHHHATFEVLSGRLCLLAQTILWLTENCVVFMCPNIWTQQLWTQGWDFKVSGILEMASTRASCLQWSTFT